MQLDHINIYTSDLAGTVGFFETVLGLKTGYRPPFTFAGAWMYGPADEPAVVHLVEDAAVGPGDTGPLDHVAFRDQDLDALTARLDQAGLRFEVRVIPRSGDRQVFFVAPFGLKIEVNFPPPA
ncbi:MAG: VOC family protein [Proteobacteria bacterium]|nr:VOC family protein [Pseudomonadota bacterium]